MSFKTSKTFPPRSKDWKHANKQLIFHQAHVKRKGVTLLYFRQPSKQFHIRTQSKKREMFLKTLIDWFDRTMAWWSGYLPILCHNKWCGCFPVLFFNSCFPVLARINFWHVGLYWCLQKNKQQLKQARHQDLIERKLISTGYCIVTLFFYTHLDGKYSICLSSYSEN